MDNGTDESSVTATAKRGRPAAKDVDQQIADLTEKIAALRTRKSEDQRKQRDELVQIIGTVMLAAANDNTPDARTILERELRARVTRPAQRELVETWLASQPAER